MQGRGRKRMFLLVVVAAKLAIDILLPDAVSFAHLISAALGWPVRGRTLLSSASRRHGLLVGHIRLLPFGRAHFSEEHYGANELFRIVIGLKVVVFVPRLLHRVPRTFPVNGQ